MRALMFLRVAPLLFVAACGDGSLAVSTGDSGAAAPAATVTVTATATQTVTVTARPTGVPDVAELKEFFAELEASSVVTPEAPPPPPKLKLRVFRDGCGVIRSRAVDPSLYRNLTWSFSDQDGFQVLGRLAENETRYRYYLGGTYTVVLEAFVNGAYRPVSNKVTVRC